MTNNNNPARNGSSAKAAGRLSMISMLAISAGLAAAPVQAQSVIAPSDMPMQSPVAVPQSAPAPAPAPAPATQTTPVTSGPVTTLPASEAKVIPPATPDRAEALAARGGFDATTVAPEALAEIESEQQARQAAARAAAEARAETARAATPRSSAPADNAAASGADSNAAAPASSTLATTESAPVAGFASAPAMIEPAPAPESAPAYADLSGETDWTLLAALAGLLGIGGVGAYAATRRRKSTAEPATAEYAAAGRETESAAIIAATMPELRRDPVAAERRNPAPPQEQQVDAKEHLTDFVAGLPSYEAPRSKADRNVTIGQRRVAAAPRPYLGEADLSRRPGYFMAHVDAIPTPQNPFLTRQKRLKRARHLDRKLAEIKAANALKPTSVNVRMHDTRPLEAAYS